MRLSSLTIVFTLASILGTGCATTTKITSEPPGATVTRESDKKELGKTPLTYESKMWIWEAEKVTVKAPGRQPKTVELKRSEADVLPLVGGICLTLTGCGCPIGLPIILAGGMKLPETTNVKLEAEKGAAPPPPTSRLEQPAGVDGIDPVDAFPAGRVAGNQAY
jgi:hypothetical protein